VQRARERGDLAPAVPLEDDVLGAKVESGRWARLRLASGAEPAVGTAALVDAAVAAQRGLAPMPGAAADMAAADGFVAAVLERFQKAGG